MQNIQFNPTSKAAEITIDYPAPASTYIPEWYKKAPLFDSSKPKFDVTNGETNQTIKMCMPFLDALSMGYIQETWCDIYFEKRNGETFFYYPSGPKPIGQRLESVFPHISGYDRCHYLWHPSWTPQLPLGYSAIITHPFNRFDLPFLTLTGIVDADVFTHSHPESNIPFLLKDDFEGMIKKGTPMYQIIPFKRENWKSEKNEFNENLQLSVISKVRQYFFNGYKKVFWNKKEYK